MEALGYRGDEAADAAAFLRELTRLRAGTGGRAVIAAMKDSCSDLEQLYRMAQPELVDYEAGVALPEEERFRDYCGAVKEFLYGGKEGPLTRHSTVRESVEVLSEDRALFSQVSDGDMLAFSALKARARPRLVTAPGWDGGTPAVLYTAGGIYAGSQNQENAWNFLKLLLEEGVFMGEGLDREGVAGSLEASMDRVPGLVEDRLEAPGWTGAPFSGADRQQILALHRDYDVCRLYSPEVYRLYEKHMTPYFQGREEYGPCAGRLRESLEEYLRS